MELRFGLNHETEHTQKEVADTLGISQSYISRLEKRIIRRLRRQPGGQRDKKLQPRRGRAYPARGLPVSRNPRKAADRTCARLLDRATPFTPPPPPGYSSQTPPRQPGDHVHLRAATEYSRYSVPLLPRPRYTGDAPGVLALGHGDTVNVVLLYILKCQVKKGRRGKASARSWPCAGSCGGPAQCRSQSPRPAPQ